MALYWPEARVAVTSANAEGAHGEKDWPPEVLVVLMREGQQECPEFVEAVRDLVASRTMERRCRALDALYELGTLVPEPEGEDVDEGEEASESQRAEARLREQLADHADNSSEADGEDTDDLWGWEHSAIGMGSLGMPPNLGSWGTSDPQVVINHCDEVVVSR